MPRKTSTTTDTTPTFTTEKPAASKKAVCKLRLEKTETGEIGTALDELMEQAKNGGITITAVRGTLTCY